jgi:branched-chain amino acid transport system ATP-binding protein
LADNGPLLDVRELSAAYGRSKILDGISFAVQPKETFVVLGANGSGKTTLLRALSGLMVKRTGNVTFMGSEIGDKPAHEIVWRGITQVPEGKHLFPVLSVAENLELGAWNLHRAGRRNEAADILDLVFSLFPRLAERRKQIAGTLSGGEQQMLAIGRALMAGPKLLLLDEPSVGLAPRVISDLADAIRKIRDVGVSVILAEQHLNLAIEVADRGIVIQLGKVVYIGDRAGLQNDAPIHRLYIGE